jgi:hypothetical protein
MAVIPNAVRELLSFSKNQYYLTLLSAVPSFLRMTALLSFVQIFNFISYVHHGCHPERSEGTIELFKKSLLFNIITSGSFVHQYDSFVELCIKHQL